MEFLRIGPVGEERPVIREAGATYDLTPLTKDLDGVFLSGGGIVKARQALINGQLPEIFIDHERVGAPVARPQAVWCIGMNYAAHAAESGSEPPGSPVLFFKTPNTIVGANDQVQIPRGSNKTDWEVELAVVIGRRAQYLDSPEAAMDYIAGYTISNDISERTFQLETPAKQWGKGKVSATFNPLGPALVPADEIDVSNLRLCTLINGEVRQDSSTADLIFKVSHLIWDLSQYGVLEAGDIVNTGTPEGVALSGRFSYLKAGDVIETSIEGLGSQRQEVVQA